MTSVKASRSKAESDTSASSGLMLFSGEPFTGTKGISPIRGERGTIVADGGKEDGVGNVLGPACEYILETLGVLISIDADIDSSPAAEGVP